VRRPHVRRKEVPEGLHRVQKARDGGVRGQLQSEAAQNIEDESHEKTVTDQPSKIEAEIGPGEEEEEVDDTPQLSESEVHHSMTKLQNRKSKRKKSMTVYRRNPTKNLRAHPGRVTTNLRCRKKLRIRPGMTTRG
jgi:hypothetical protein